MPGSHSLVSPSGAHRWMACTRAPTFEANFPESSSVYADEGTLAHSLSDWILMQRLKIISPKKAKLEITKVKEHELYKPEMLTLMDEYSLFCLEVFSEHLAKYYEVEEGEHPRLMIEQKLDLTHWIPEGKGTGDRIITSDYRLTFIDLKYGKNEVSAIENKQLMIYALGAWKKFKSEFSFEEVELIIYQPRLDNISRWIISVKDLVRWGRHVMRPLARKAFTGDGEFNPGKEQCKFCRGKERCKALAEYNLDLLRHEFKIDNYLDDDGVIEFLEKGPLLIDQYEHIKKYALSEATTKGKIWDGFKVVAGRSNRSFRNKKLVLWALKYFYGHTDEDIFKQELKTLTELENLLGKSDFIKKLGRYVHKPKGSPTLVPLSDKRPALGDIRDAFSEYIIED